MVKKRETTTCPIHSTELETIPEHKNENEIKN